MKEVTLSLQGENGPFRKIVRRGENSSFRKIVTLIKLLFCEIYFNTV